MFESIEEDLENKEYLASFHKKHKARLQMYNIVDEKVRSENRGGVSIAAEPLIKLNTEDLDVKGLGVATGEVEKHETERMTITYGYVVGTMNSPYEILAICCEKMAELNMEWKVVGKDYKLKVRSCTDQLQPGANIDEFMKHYFLKFTLQVQRVGLLTHLDLQALKLTRCGRPSHQRPADDLHRLLLPVLRKIKSSALRLPDPSILIILFIWPLSSSRTSPAIAPSSPLSPLLSPSEPTQSKTYVLPSVPAAQP